MEVLGSVTTIIAVVTAAKDVIELGMQIKETLQQVKQNRRDHADQIQEILDLLDDLHTACKGIKSERPGLQDAVNKLKSNLGRQLKCCQDMVIPQGFVKALWKSGSIKKTLEGVKADITTFLTHFATSSNIRIEKQTSENSDKLDRLLASERTPSYSRRLSSGYQSPTVSSRKTKEYLLGRLQKLSKSLATGQPLSQRISSPIYPDRLVSNTHRPHLLDTNNGLLDAIAKTQSILETYTDSASDSAHSLDNLSVALMDVGLADQASEISSISVRIYENAQTAEPDSNFAIALHNHSHHLSAARRVNEAVGQAQRAVDIYHRLQGGVFDPGRAKALDNLAACLLAVGKKEEALSVSNEAVHISRDLQRKHPNERLSADLAMLLSNRANILQALRYNKDALKDASESRAMYQELYQGSLSGRYTAEYAESLRVHSEMLLDLGHYLEARDPARLAVELWGELNTMNPNVYSPKLARGLLTLFDILSGLHRYLDAEANIHKAVEMFRNLAANFPEVFDPQYALALHKKAQVLTDQKRHREEEAIGFLEEALAIYGTLPPGKWDVEFAAVYDDKYICHTRLKQFAEAAQASRSAISIRKKAYPSAKNQKTLTKSRGELAHALYNLSIQPKTSVVASIGPALEAVELWTLQLAETPDNTGVRRSLVIASRSLSLFYSDSKQYKEALKYAKLSVNEGIKLGDNLLLEQARTRLAFCHRNRET
ncbi:hypothetical protein C8R44DRAFT_161921 [Mycena epipterygia]|nr:hypothetical protein C8R44DRAFT_161921 [Mycena epipterygia]